MSNCDWGLEEVNKRYHDVEWGVPVHDDRIQFEYLMMEVMQCGLSWSMMMKKREIFRTCFEDFDFERIAAYGEQDIERILNTDGMIRSRRKVEAVIRNAQLFQEIRTEYGSFSNWLWAFSGGKTILYMGHEKGNVPVSNGLSDQISKELKKRGFKFLGSVTIYAHLQACGIINDHGADCPRYEEINRTYPTVRKRRYQEKRG